MRFVDLLTNAAWTARYRDTVLDAPRARALVERAAGGPPGARPPPPQPVFLGGTPRGARRV